MISYNGFNVMVMTMEKKAGTNMLGKLATVESGKIKEPADGKDFIGVCVSERDDYVGVQLEGYVECSYTGTAPEYGNVNLVASSNGAVKSSSTAGTTRRVIKVDTANNIVGFIL